MLTSSRSIALVQKLQHFALQALSSQQEAQPNMDHVFRPIQATEIIENPSDNTLSAPDIIPGQPVPSYVLPPQESARRQSMVKTECDGALQQVQQHNLPELTALGNVSAISSGRPSSAVIPAAGAMPVSPALSLNFQIGMAVAHL